LSVDRNLLGTSKRASHPARPAPAVAPHGPRCSADACRSAIGRPILLKAAGRPSELRLYPDTPHAFFADYRPSYREAEAKDGWAKLVAWFKKHGVE
jgi:carboxymethylenebutenolidase